MKNQQNKNHTRILNPKKNPACGKMLSFIFSTDNDDRTVTTKYHIRIFQNECVHKS